jgi:hypothetical protein
MALVPHAAGTSPVPPVMRRATIAARLPQKTVTLNHPSTEYYVLFIRRIRFRRGNTVANAGGFPEGSRQIETEKFFSSESGRGNFGTRGTTPKRDTLKKYCLGDFRRKLNLEYRRNHQIWIFSAFLGVNSQNGAYRIGSFMVRQIIRYCPICHDADFPRFPEKT